MSLYMIKEHKNFLSPDNINFIENVMLNDNFPFYIKQSATHNSKGEPNNETFLNHVILHNLESKLASEVVNSDYYEVALSMLQQFTKAIKQEVHFFTRITFNLTFANGLEKSGTHVDHRYPHKQIILYLNDCDKNAKTVIVDDKDKIIKTITPQKYKGICFDSLPHYQIFPKHGLRLILVATFI